MDYVSKFLLLEYMTENNQDQELFSINKLHSIDKITYQIVDDMNYYEKYYKEYLEINKDKTDRIKIISEYIGYRLLGIKYENPIIYQRYILECIKTYYKWKNFMKNHEGKYLLNKYDLEYLKKIEDFNIEDLINELEYDFDFYVTVVGEHLYYKTQKIEIKEEIIDKYYNNTSSNNVKKKLK